MMEPETKDVVIIGAGPAGLAAAQAASENGLSVRLIDEQAAAGGQIWRNAARMSGAGGLSKSYEGARGALKTLEHALVYHAASATLLDAGLVRAPVVPHVTNIRANWLSALSGERGMRETTARAMIITTGAMERPILFPGATLPGVMGVGAVQSILKQSGLVPDAPGVILAGQGPLLLLTLVQILDQGGSVDAVLDLGNRGALRAALPGLLPAWIGDPKLMLQGATLLRRARRSGVQWIDGVQRLQAHGTDGVEEVEFESDGKIRRLPCSLLAVHDGVIPNTQLSRLLNLEHVWSDTQQAFASRCDPLGRTSEGAIWAAGDGAGIGGVELAGTRGTLAGLDVARSLGKVDEATFERQSAPLLKLATRRAPTRVFIDRLYPPLAATAHADDADRTIVCRCEAVTLANVREAISDGANGPNRVKTFTRIGMGPCQGRMCGNALTRIVAEATGSHPQDVGALRIRPPLKPTLISDYLAEPSTETSQ